ncbi:MAG: hypothetical protein ACYC8S_01355 [Minisyncoccota bacterium]
MKNFIKENWFKVGLLIILVAVVFIYWNQTQKQKVVSVSPSITDSQASCADEAKLELNSAQNNPVAYNANFNNFNESNHYNQNLNKCFVLISYKDVAGTQINAIEYLTEVNLSNAPWDNWTVADCDRTINTPDTTMCFTKGSDHIAKDVSYKEFEAFVNQKMELNQ